MNPELHYFLTQGPYTVKDLARLTELSTSTIYKSIKEYDGIQTKDTKVGKVFWIAPEGETGPAEETVPEPSLDAEKAMGEGKAAEPVESTQTGLKAERRGRKATGAGKKLWPGPSLKTEYVGAGFDWINPRRKGSHGYRSLQIVIDKPGIETEDYVAEGGRLVDLRWDLARGRIEMKG